MGDGPVGSLVLACSRACLQAGLLAGMPACSFVVRTCMRECACFAQCSTNWALL